MYGVGGRSSWKSEKGQSIKRSSHDEKMEEQEDLDVFMGEEEAKSSYDAPLSSLMSAVEVDPDTHGDGAQGPTKKELTTQVISMPRARTWDTHTGMLVHTTGVGCTECIR